MPLEQHKKTIMEHDYTTVFITGSKGVALLSKLMSYVGSAQSSLQEALKINIDALLGGDEAAGVEVAMHMVKILPEIMDDSFLPFTFEIFQHTMRDGRAIGEKAVFDDVFAGNYAELFYALGWVIYVNYCKDLKDFFMKALNQVKELNLSEKLKTLLNESPTD